MADSLNTVRFTVANTELKAALQSVAPFASKDRKHRELATVQLWADPVDRTVSLVATDAFVLIRYTLATVVKESRVWDLGGWTVRIPIGRVRPIVSSIGRPGDVTPVAVTPKGLASEAAFGREWETVLVRPDPELNPPAPRKLLNLVPGPDTIARKANGLPHGFVLANLATLAKIKLPGVKDPVVLFPGTCQDKLSIRFEVHETLRRDASLTPQVYGVVMPAKFS